MQINAIIQTVITMNQTYQTNEIGAKTLIQFYKDQQIESTNQYIKFAAKLKHCTISLYTSNKVVFQGNSIEEETQIWDANPNFQSTNKQTTISSKKENNSQTLPQCGSDEVGTGDYFGPVTVCASYIDKEILSKINEFNLTDSKVLTDEYIRKIAPILMEIVPHSVVILDNQKYNEIQQTNNLNAIKAKLHNACYIHLEKKIQTLPKLCIVDQFAEEDIYYHYLKNLNHVIRNLHFETKAESKYISVAISSIIARYAFLKSMDKLSETYQMEFPKGAGTKVDEFGKEFIDKYSEEELTKVAKMHFKNTDKIKCK